MARLPLPRHTSGNNASLTSGVVVYSNAEPKPLRPMLVSGEVAVALNFLRGDGTPDRRKVRKLAREGRIPAPVDPELHALDHRWARRDIEAYANGEWTPARGSLPARREVSA